MRNSGNPGYKSVPISIQELNLERRFQSRQKILPRRVPVTQRKILLQNIETGPNSTFAILFAYQLASLVKILPAIICCPKNNQGTACYAVSGLKQENRFTRATLSNGMFGFHIPAAPCLRVTGRLRCESRFSYQRPFAIFF